MWRYTIWKILVRGELVSVTSLEGSAGAEREKEEIQAGDTVG